MSVILDIDLDYFRFFDEPLERLDELLAWADRPVDAVFKDHHEALRRSKRIAYLQEHYRLAREAHRKKTLALLTNRGIHIED